MEIEISDIPADREEGFLVLEPLVMLMDVGLADGEQRFLAKEELITENGIQKKKLVLFVFLNIDARELERVVLSILKEESFQLFDEFIMELLHIRHFNFKRRNDGKVKIGITLIFCIKARPEAFDVLRETIFRIKSEAEEKLRLHMTPRENGSELCSILRCEQE